MAKDDAMDESRAGGEPEQTAEGIEAAGPNEKAGPEQAAEETEGDPSEKVGPEQVEGSGEDPSEKAGSAQADGELESAEPGEEPEAAVTLADDAPEPVEAADPSESAAADEEPPVAPEPAGANDDAEPVGAESDAAPADAESDAESADAEDDAEPVDAEDDAEPVDAEVESAEPVEEPETAATLTDGAPEPVEVADTPEGAAADTPEGAAAQEDTQAAPESDGSEDEAEQDDSPDEPAPALGADAPTREFEAVPAEPPVTTAPPVITTPPVTTAPPVRSAPPERTAVLRKPERPTPAATPEPPATAAQPQRPAPAPQPQRPAPAPQSQRPAEPAQSEHPLEIFAGAERPRRRTGRVLGGIAAVLVVVAGAYVAASWALADRVPRGVTVAGVDIGGQQADVAVATLSEELRSATTEPIVVTAGDRSVTLDPAQSGLQFDPDATVAGLTGFTLEPARLWQHLFGLGEQPPVTQVDTETLDASVAAVATALVTEPVDGRIVFADAAAHATPAQDGIAVDEPAASEVLSRTWLTAPRPVALPVVAVAPAITQEETDRAMARLARPLASGPVGVLVEGQVAELPSDVVTEAATVAPEGSQLVLRLDGEQLVDEVLKRTRDLLSDAEDARFEFVDGEPQIVAGTAGTWLDPEHVATAVRNAALGSPRTASLALSEVDPEQTTKALEDLGITELVSVFETAVTSDRARTANLERGAELVAGVLVRPGETFSLNETIGPISADNGYGSSTVVVNGVIQEGMGGGLSQMGTTMFNAAYFAGFEDIEHRPHSYWFSRYPEGREATIYEGVLDVKWLNNTPYGALLNSYVANGRLYVEVWGTEHFEVETSKSGRSRVTAPTTRYNTQSGCIAQPAGNPGFEVTNTRVVLLDGEEVERTSYTWRYNPQDAIVCGSPPRDDDDEDED